MTKQDFGKLANQEIKPGFNQPIEQFSVLKTWGVNHSGYLYFWLGTPVGKYLTNNSPKLN